jgi:hypothetical protein
MLHSPLNNSVTNTKAAQARKPAIGLAVSRVLHIMTANANQAVTSHHHERMRWVVVVLRYMFA